MKRRMIGPALALQVTLMGGAANADELLMGSAAYEAMTYPMMAQFLGNQKHNRCPRFKVIDAATRAELAIVRWGDRGMTEADMRDPGGEDQPGFKEKYETDPSAFCKFAWELLGPNGTYKRQMLEAK
jgi:hypothetical protein